MTGETEPLRLRVRTYGFDRAGQPFVETHQGERQSIPADHLWFVERALKGASIADLSLALTTSSAPSRLPYRALAEFLVFADKQNWLEHPKQIELVESLRADYRWPESLAYSEIFGLDVIRSAARPWQSAGVGGAIFFLALQMAAAVYGIGLLIAAQAELFPVHAALALFLIFSIGRTCWGLSEYVATRLFGGSEVRLRLRLDLASVSLVALEPRPLANSARSLAAFASLFSLIWGSALIASRFYGAPMAALTSLFLLVELSPLRGSRFTSALRLLFLKWSNDLKRVANIQLAVVLTWSIALVVFLGFGAPLLLSYTRRLLAGPTFLEGLLFALWIVIASLTLIDDIWSGVYPDRNRKSLRRLWQRRISNRDRLAQASAVINDPREIARLTAELPLFRQLGVHVQTALLRGPRVRVRTVEQGEALCLEGETDRSLFVLLSGRAEVTKKSGGRRRRITTLQAGSIFGEAAFFLAKPRTADVTTLEECRVVVIPHDEKINALSAEKSEALQLRVWFLQALMASPLFRELPAEAFDALLFAGERREYKPGETVFREGEKGDACYFIVQGEVRVVQNFKELRRLRAGEAFGEISLLRPDLLRTATIRTEAAMIAVRVEAATFRQLLNSHLNLAVELETLAGARLEADEIRSQLKN